MNVLSLFAGIGGLDLGLERAGMRVVGQVEIAPFCQRVLAKHWPEVPRHDDVRTAVDWWTGEPRPAVHVVAGGFPCQPVSNAGRGLAQADPRWLWPYMAQTIEALCPDWVVAENVPGLRKRGLADVLGDLDRLGYRARAGYISASEVGAPHERERIFVLAHAHGFGRIAGWHDTGQAEVAEPVDRGPLGDTASIGCPVRPGLRQGAAGSGQPSRVQFAEPADAGWWAAEPDVGRVAYGIPARVDRLRSLGNAVVPQVAEHIGRLVMAAAS